MSYLINIRKVYGIKNNLMLCTVNYIKDFSLVPLKSINLFHYSLNAFQRSLFINFCCSTCAFCLVPFLKLRIPMFPKTFLCASGKCVDSYDLLTCILEVIPPALVRASLEPYVREATFFLWVKIVRGTRTAKLIRFIQYGIPASLPFLHTHIRGNKLFRLN